MRMANRWTIGEVVLAVLSVAAFVHSYRFEMFDWEMYVASVIAITAVAVSVIAFIRDRERRVVAAVCGTVGLLVAGHSLTELFMAYAFTGHMP